MNQPTSLEPKTHTLSVKKGQETNACRSTPAKPFRFPSIAFVLLLLMANSFGQDVFLKGKLLTFKSVAIPHAYVTLANLKIGDSTDATGAFALKYGSFVSVMQRPMILAENVQFTIENQNLVLVSNHKINQLQCKVTNLVGATVYSVEMKDIAQGRSILNLSNTKGKFGANGTFLLTLTLDGKSYSVKCLNTHGITSVDRLSEVGTQNTSLSRKMAAITDTLIVYKSNVIVNKMPISTYFDTALSVPGSADTTPILAHWNFPIVNGQVTLSQTSGLVPMGTFIGFRADLSADTGSNGVVATGNEWTPDDPGIGVIAEYNPPKDFSKVSVVMFTLQEENLPTQNPGIQAYLQNGPALKYAGDYNFYAGAPKKVTTMTYKIDPTATGMDIKKITSFRIKGNGALNQPSGTGCGDPGGTCLILHVRKVMMQ